MTPVIPDTSAPDQPDVGWGLARRMAFRLVFLYTLLYSFCYFVPVPTGAREFLVDRVGEALFGRPARSHLTGSGDTWFDWMTLLVVASVSVVGVLVCRCSTATDRTTGDCSRGW